jgi:hypothetical protein
LFAGSPQPARINTVLVGPTNSGRKGTSAYPVDRLAVLAVPKLWKTQRVSGLATGEGLIAKVADRWVYDEEKRERVQVPTEKRLYVVEQEFSRVLAQARRDGNVLSQVIREAFDSGDLHVLTRGDPLTAQGAHVCVTGHITPEELSARLSTVDMANGFGNRFAWFAVRSEKLLPETVPIPSGVIPRFAPRLTEVASYPAGPMTFTPAAAELWAGELYPGLRADRPGLAGAMTARGTAFVLRTALTYCLLDAPAARRHVDVCHLRAAFAVWEYARASADLLFGGGVAETLGDRILSLLAAGPMKKSQFTDHIGRPVAEIDRELATLQSAGRIRRGVRSSAGPGRPAEVWERVPNN